MGMLDQLLANLYPPAKQEKTVPLTEKQSAQALKAQLAASLMQSSPTTVTEGQVLCGEILDLRANQILVLLENGTTVSARTEGTLNLSIGENARFFVAQTKEDQIVLKHVKEDSKAENPMIDKALTAAGITRTERSVSIVTELLSHSQPVTGTNIRHYLSLSAKYPELPVKDFVLMELHRLPVTPETVSQFAAYHDGNGKLLAQATRLVSELTSQLEKLPGSEEKQQLMQEFAKLVSTDSENKKSTMPAIESGITPAGTVQDTGTLSEPGMPSSTMPPDMPSGSTMTPDMPNGSTITPGISDSSTPESEPLLKNFLDSFLLVPEDVADSDKVKDYYEEMNYKLAVLEQLAEKIAETGKESVATAPKQMRSNLSFMDSINQVFPFLQLPLKFKETPAHGELYVYERKKALKPTDSFRALLHLDMEALGTMDVFITLAGQNVTSRFFMTDKSSADLIRAELPSLAEALAKKGYSFTSDVTVTEPSAEIPSPTLLEQFLEEHAPGGLERYTFDIRA